jgi:hypothetical protein
MGRGHRHRDSNRTGQLHGIEVPHEGSRVHIPQALGIPLQDAADALAWQEAAPVRASGA